MRMRRERGNLRVTAARTGVRTASVAAALAAAAALLTGTGSAQAAPSAAGAPSAPGSDLARFEGRTLDLSGDWGEAKACLIRRSAGTVQCFRTVAELTAKEAELTALAGRTTAAGGALAACSSPVRLYEHGQFWTGGGGRVLSFWDRGYWQNLGNWDFNDNMSSYKVGACTAHLAEHNGGGGYWYPGNTGPWAEEGVLRSGWNDRVSSIKID
ncbi:hypothetical protein [Streptomyces sp. NPDC097619]|uniref:hypothetical protein n=1 Tax=Streptomyces sp. NPDC097619 TaxID=3157228 RepID=UPI003328063B